MSREIDRLVAGFEDGVVPMGVILDWYEERPAEARKDFDRIEEYHAGIETVWLAVQEAMAERFGW